MNKLKIKNNIQISDNYFLLELDGSNISEKINPGQFFDIRLNNGNSYDPLLRRPLSIHDIDTVQGNFYLLYRVVGRGTKLLSEFKSDEYIDILGPLGTGFTSDFNNKEILLIGGGMGIAPLYYLVKKLYPVNKLIVLLGGNTKKDLIYFSKKFQELKIDVRSATIDGSLGYKGNVIDLWLTINKFNFNYLYTCGPLPMLKKVQEYAAKYHINGEVSVEERMGCGIGLCLSCVCKTKAGNKRVCKEGPVFQLNKIELT